MKKPASSKRTSLPRSCDYTKRFLKDFASLSENGRFDMRKLKQIMMIIVANDGSLPPEYKDHALIGEWQGHRDCHIGGDFVLIYKLDTTTKPEAVVFVRAGTHATVFEN